MNLKKIFSDNGYFVMAFAIVVVTLFSVIAITHVGFADGNNLIVDYQKIQQVHLMRSESSRGVVVAKDEVEDALGALGTSGGFSSIDLDRVIYELEPGFGKFTFKVRSKVYQEASDEVSPFASNTVLNISSLGKAYTGHSNLKDSGVAMFSKKIIKNQTFAGFHYFTDNEDSINADLGDTQKVKFWGPDVIHGIVRSNTDIYIQQAGGGDNNGWPTFHDHVYTSGEIRPYAGSGSIPEDDVFLDDFTENLPQIEFPEDAALARTGRIVDIDPGDAMLAQVNGVNHSLWYMDRVLGATDTVVVYDLGDMFADDPDTVPREDSMGVQHLTQIDTIWSFDGSGRIQNNAIFFTGELWIEGTFAGKQTWASQDTMYLVGDILLAGTEKGSAPDGFDPETGEFSGPVNQNDYVGLVSEKSILIQYGYRSPEDSTRIKNNCGRYEDLDGDQDEGGIYIYAGMVALGQGELSMEDGVFSFQYHHPHPGLIARVDGEVAPLADFELYNIAPYDNGWGPLHFFFSDERDMPWPPDWCFPYYGPLWPESAASTFKERGTINLWGTVAQRRRGFVHRSGSDPINTGGAWDIANYRYGSHPDALPIGNAPGATGGGVGYKKNYNYDYRFQNNPPVKFPQVHMKAGGTELDTDSWYLYRAKDAPYDLIF